MFCGSVHSILVAIDQFSYRYQCGVREVMGFRLLSFAAVLYLCAGLCDLSLAQQERKPFTVADEIGLAVFGSPFTGHAKAVQFSPDGTYFAVYTERGRLDVDRPEDSLRFYESQDIEGFLKHSGSQLRPPVWVVTRSSYKEGPIINDWRWLADSSGVAFLEPTTDGRQQLILADLRTRTIEPLISTMDTVRAFDVHDRQDYVYTVADSEERERLQAEMQVPAIIGTGRSLFQLLFPHDPLVGVSSHRSHLWAVVGGRHFEIKRDGRPLVLFNAYGDDLALSPDGRSLVTTLPIWEVPSSWEMLYPAPFASSHDRIHAGPQNEQVDTPVHQYVRINLQTESVQALTNAPSSNNDNTGWVALGSPGWSSDGQAILLLGTFLKSKDNAPSRPCVAVVDLPSNSTSCVEVLKGRTESGVEHDYHLVVGGRFAGGDTQRVDVTFIDHVDQSHRTTEYLRKADGTWEVVKEIKGEPVAEHGRLELTVKQGFNEPPVLVAADEEISRVVWDPNPQLKNIELGQASVYKWKDKAGREWRGGLYRPRIYVSGRRYPLVIQTHGFSESEFRPSGVLPTAFAARALAAAGIAVLQVAENCPVQSPDEGPCAVSGYESAANQLVSEGLVDPERIGIIGFSRTCFYVMEMLTTGSSHLKAASVTDGVMGNYFQYMLQPERLAGEFDSMIGAAPFSGGLQQWLRRSPGFNLDKIHVPLLVVSGEGPAGLLLMWEPYAGLRSLHKPVDLIMLNTDEHVLSNPAVRMASQGGSVDWFRFWLKDEEDPNSAKKEQYARWRALRKLQEENEKE